MGIDHVQVKPHPYYPDTHWIGLVTTKRGYCYFCSWGIRPTEEEVRLAWKEDRKSFRPYYS